MTDQLALSSEAPPTGKRKYTLEQHEITRRLFACEWADGDLTGIHGPLGTDTTEQGLDETAAAYPQQRLPFLDYSRNPGVIRWLRDDMLAKRFTAWIRADA
jgi:hypothetical protein